MFNHAGRDSSFIIENDKNTPSFEEAMFLDIVRSMRKDMKVKDTPNKGGA